ncbi:hypothetical protein JCM13304A_23290 [Desulfothermus okinawensis JCM 13304]
MIYSDRVYVKIPRDQIGYFKFILESYENLCYMSVIDRFEAVIKISYLKDQVEELELFLSSLEKEIGLEIIYPKKWKEK